MPDVWILLRIRSEEEGHFLLNVSDDRGGWRRVRVGVSKGHIRLAQKPGWPHDASDLREFVSETLRRNRALWSDAPFLVGLKGTGGTPLPLPLFVLVDPPGTGISREMLMDWVDIPPDQLRSLVIGIVPPAGGSRIVTPPKFSVATVGRSLAPKIHMGLENLPWINRIENLRDSDLVRTYPGVEAMADGGFSPEIVFADAGEVPGFLEMARERRGYSPRLLVTSPGQGLESLRKAGRLPGNLAVLASDSFTPEFARDLLTNMTHDLPIHSAAVLAGGLGEADSGSDSRLYANPYSNSSLLISSAYDELLKDQGTLPSLPELGALKEANPDPGELGDRIDRLHEIVRGLNARPVRFDQEGGGIVPMSEMRVSLGKARELELELRGSMEEVADALQPVGRPENSERASPEDSERRVDVKLERFSRDLWQLSGKEFTADSIQVGTGDCLRASTAYRLTIAIGRTFTGSLLPEKPPGIDHFLSPSETGEYHELEVVLFEQDFKVGGKRILPLKLPKAQGAGEPVTYVIRTPAEAGTARLRFGIYQGQQLLQSFRLEARVAGDPENMEELPESGEARDSGDPEVTGVSVKLDYCRTRRFDNLDYFPKRDLNISFNRSGASHYVMFKNGGRSWSIGFSDPQIDSVVGRFRKSIHLACEKDRAAGADVESCIRDFAKLGGELYRSLFASRDADQTEYNDELADLRSDTPRTIQINRLHRNDALPWPIIYDYLLPHRDDVDKAPVCLGTSCECDRDPLKGKTICIRGFWGVRHRLEILIDPDFGIDPRDETQPVLPREPYRASLTLGLEDEMTAGLLTGLQALTAETGGFLGPNPQRNFLGHLWDPAQRPAISVLLCRLGNSATQPDCRELHISANPRQRLAEEDIANQTIALGRCSKEPHLLMLMACESFTVAPEALVSLRDMFLRAGVTVIAGTECSIYASQAKDFTLKVLKCLFENETLGEAVRHYRAEMLRNGRPHAFTFSCIGNADTRFEPPATIHPPAHET